MKINKFKLEHFKPIAHNGLSSIDSEIVSDVVILIGVNGSGKSMVLNELTPLAALKPMYTKEGYKYLEITHNKTDYVLISDFKNKEHTHCFFKNNEDLNVSGNANVQNDLVYKEFGLTNISFDMINFKYKMSSLTKQSRKEILFASYPGDLNFVLNKHKQVAKTMREYGSQLKLLKTRESAIKNSMLSEDNIDSLRSLQKYILDGNRMLDQLLFSSEQDLNHFTKEQSQYINDSFNIMELTDKYKEIDNKLINMDKSILNDNLNNCELQLDKLNVKRGNVSHENQRLTELGRDVKSEIEKYEDYLDSNVADEIKEISNKLDVLRTEVSEISIPSDIEIIPFDMLDNFENNISIKLREMILNLCNGEYIMEPDKIDKTTAILTDLNWNITQSKNLTDNETMKLNKLNERLVREIDASYNIKCVLNCKLKENKDLVVSNLTKDIEVSKEFLNTNKVKLVDYEKQYKELKSTYEYSCTNKAIIVQIQQFFTTYSWSKYLLNGFNLFSLLNQNSSLITNRLNLLIKFNKQYYHKIKCEEDIKINALKLKTLHGSQLPADELISKTLLSKQTEMHHILNELNKLSKLQQAYGVEYKSREDMLNICRTVHIDLKLVEDRYRYLEIQYKKEVLNSFRDECTKHKDTLNHKLVDINSTIKEYDNHVTVLNNEVLPTLKEIQSKYDLYVILEKGLSPKSGLPKQYMITFLNSLIDQVNMYINRIWSYPLEIEKLTLESDLKFEFKVRLNQTSSISDMKMLSFGQKNIVDLAWCLTLYQSMGLSDYPLKLDEVDSNFSEDHRLKLLEMLGEIMRSNEVNQMLIVNHHPSLYGCFSDSQVIALSESGILLPSNYNETTKLI